MVCQASLLVATQNRERLKINRARERDVQYYQGCPSDSKDLCVHNTLSLTCMTREKRESEDVDSKKEEERQCGSWCILEQ